MDVGYAILITGLTALSAYLIGVRKGARDVNRELRSFLSDRTKEMKEWRDRALLRRGQSPLDKKTRILSPEEREKKTQDRASATPYRVVQRTELIQRAIEQEAKSNEKRVELKTPKAINITRAIEKAEQIKKSG